ncbi:MAG TPA: phosphoglycolate phosphatase [Steroidobacteraceae bacterium]
MSRAQGVLLDLDGTLLDTAPDMTHALNALRAEHALPALALADIRPHVSHGSNAVVRAGFPEAAADEFARLRERFLQLYRDMLAVDTRLFEGFAPVLERLDTQGVPWGIVTNKPGWLSAPLLQAMGLAARAGCLISGDTLPVRKPDPLPLLTAAQQLRCPPGQALYLGDALRDVQAARAAGMLALGARYGYIGADEDVSSWPADGWIETPRQLLDWVALPAETLRGRSSIR